MTRAEIAVAAMQGLLAHSFAPHEVNGFTLSGTESVASMAFDYADAFLKEQTIRLGTPPPADNPNEKGAARVSPVEERPAGERAFADAICEIALVAAHGFDKAQYAEIECRRALEKIAEIVGAVADEARLARGGARAAG